MGYCLQKRELEGDMEKEYVFEAVLKKVADVDGAYVEIPFDVREAYVCCMKQK